MQAIFVLPVILTWTKPVGIAMMLIKIVKVVNLILVKIIDYVNNVIN